MTSATTLPTATATNGLAATATNFVVGDRGCLPLMGTSAQAATQTATVQLVLGQIASGTLTGAIANTDYGAYIQLLCSTSGTCCTTNLCNGSGKIQMNLATTFISSTLIVLGLMGIWNKWNKLLFFWLNEHYKTFKKNYKIIKNLKKK